MFRDYNEAVWPAQFGLLVLAAAGFVFVFVRNGWSDLVASLILAFLWTWLAVAYHLAFFVSINPLAYAFCAISLVGGWLFLGTA